MERPEYLYLDPHSGVSLKRFYSSPTLYAMHIAIRVLLIWSLIGSIIPCAMIAAPMLLSGRYSVKTKVMLAVGCWPQLTVVVLFTTCVASVMKLRHKLRPEAQIPPPGNAR